ncbi:MAG: hypothetical protein Q7J73_08245 [Dehalococcoidales bacterium]|nr:hypothetical protein [Dehalococcoidales bacterium]
MKILLILVCIAAAAASPVSAQKAGDIGAGVSAGPKVYRFGRG